VGKEEYRALASGRMTLGLALLRCSTRMRQRLPESLRDACSDSRVRGRITAALDGPFAGLRASLASLWLLALLAVAAIAADRRVRVARLGVVPEPETVARQPDARRSVSSRFKKRDRCATRGVRPIVPA
jgi:hypothetical protein